MNLKTNIHPFTLNLHVCLAYAVHYTTILLIAGQLDHLFHRFESLENAGLGVFFSFRSHNFVLRSNKMSL